MRVLVYAVYVPCRQFQLFCVTAGNHGVIVGHADIISCIGTDVIQIIILHLQLDSFFFEVRLGVVWIFT
ncbi:hypothetical protein D3C75_1305030 [compost metagenome]